MKETAKFGKTLSVDLFFYPHEEGEFSDDIIIRTNAGDFTVACTGKRLATRGSSITVIWKTSATDGAPTTETETETHG